MSNVFSCHSRVPYVVASQSPAPDITSQLIQMLAPSKSAEYGGAWPQSQPSGYVDPNYAYAYASQYAYAQPVG